MSHAQDDADVAESVWQAFQDTWNEAGLDPAKCYLAFETLRLGYGDPSRHYHDFHHILYGLHQFEVVPQLVTEVGDELLAVKLAWLYHDVFYDPASPKGVNERRSADIASRAMTQAGGDPLFIKMVEGLIMVTVHDDEHQPQTSAEQIIVDIDLIALADAWSAFQADSQRIREEYRRVEPDDAVFWAKRARFLQAMLDRPSIYYTDVCRILFEQQARENLRRAVLEVQTG